MKHHNPARSQRSGALTTSVGIRCLLAFALLLCLSFVASAQAAMQGLTTTSFGSALYKDGKLREFLVRNGRVYRRVGSVGDWENITAQFDGVNRVGDGEITAFDAEVYSDGLYRMFLSRGGSVYRITERQGGGWSAWENVDHAFGGTGTAAISSFTVSRDKDGWLSQYLVRAGRVYARRQSPPNGTWSAWYDHTGVADWVGSSPTARVTAYHKAIHADGLEYQFVTRGDRIHRIVEPQFETFEDITSAFVSVGGARIARADAPIRTKVMVIDMDPLIASLGNQPLSRAMPWWNSPRTMERFLIDQMESITDGVVQFSVVRHLTLREFPTFVGGTVFGEQEYLACATAWSTCTESRKLDYAKLLRDKKICELANADTIDEVWLMGGAFFGFAEARMAGPGAFNINGEVIGNTTCNVKLPVMGFSYEGFEYDDRMHNMLENMAHRMEYTMWYKFGPWRNFYQPIPPLPFPTNPNLLERFTARGFDSTTAACGNAHGSLNTPVPDSDPDNAGQYNRDDRHMEENTCDDWERYPALTGATTRNNCDKWGCTDLGWNRYWLGKIPNFAGRNGSLRNNWWAYVLDWDAAQ